MLNSAISFDFVGDITSMFASEAAALKADVLGEYNYEMEFALRLNQDQVLEGSTVNGLCTCADQDVDTTSESSVSRVLLSGLVLGVCALVVG